MLGETRIAKKIKISEFINILKDYKREDILCTPHIFFRFSEKQKEIFNCDTLKDIILEDSLFLVGIQYNERYALFYRYEDKILKVILNLENRKVKIVTFYFIQEWQIPKI